MTKRNIYPWIGVIHPEIERVFSNMLFYNCPECHPHIRTRPLLSVLDPSLPEVAMLKMMFADCLDFGYEDNLVSMWCKDPDTEDTIMVDALHWCEDNIRKGRLLRLIEVSGLFTSKRKYAKMVRFYRDWEARLAQMIADERAARQTVQEARAAS